MCLPQCYAHHYSGGKLCCQKRMAGSQHGKLEEDCASIWCMEIVNATNDNTKRGLLALLYKYNSILHTYKKKRYCIQDKKHCDSRDSSLNEARAMLEMRAHSAQRWLTYVSYMLFAHMYADSQRIISKYIACVSKSRATRWRCESFVCYIFMIRAHQMYSHTISRFACI